MVSFARPIQPQPRCCELADLVRRVVQATHPQAEANGVRVEAELDGARTVEADPELLVQALVNLTDNACQAMRGGGRVRIRARSDETWRVIDVEDDGPGLPPEVAVRLFRPFVTTRADGHGLGLAIAQNIVLCHGGRIEARSNAPARGTTFAVWLPVGGTT
jgi:signal transduction histidine kinase